MSDPVRASNLPLDTDELFHLLVESALEYAIFMLDANGRVLTWNRGAERLKGYTAAEIVGRHFSCFYPPELAEHPAQVLAAAARDGSFHEEGWRVRKDGRRFWADITVRALRSADGSLRGFTKLTRDITDKRRSEERESEERFHVLADQAPVMVWTTDPAGDCTWQNRPWLEFRGREAEQELGNGWMDGVHPDDRARRKGVYDEAFGKREPFRLEYRLQRGDGAYRWVLDHGIPRAGSAGEFLGYVGSCVDVTESRLAADATTRANDRLRLLSEASLALTATLETESRLPIVARLPVPDLADGSIVLLRRESSAALLAISYHRDPQTNQALDDVLKAFPPVEDGVFLARALSAAGSRPFEVTRERLGRISRSREHLEALARLGVRQGLALPLQAAGKLVGALVLLRTDAAARFEPEDVVVAEELARRVSGALDQGRLYAELVQANRLKDDFLATLSHELRTPLNAIVGWAHLLRSGGLGEDDVRKAVDTIHRNAMSQTQLISDILDVSRFTAGKLRLIIAPLDFEQVVRSALDSLVPAAEAKEQKLEVVISGALPPISGDEDRLRQVVWNLVSNAIKFTPKHGRVQVRLERPNSRVALVVEDTGPGIDPDFLPYLFERFRQADRSPTRQQRGLGLGLAIVRNLVELHGGQVTAHNRSERSGAVFVVSLPLRSVEERRAIDTPSDGISEASAPDLSGVRVVVVDDQPDALELIAAVLTRCGATVSTAGNGEEALALVQAQRPAVLLADIEMPGLDGYQLIQRLRRLPAEAGGLTPAAALTAFVRPDDRYRALVSGFQMHVAKPVHPAELAAVVASLAGVRQPAPRSS